MERTTATVLAASIIVGVCMATAIDDPECFEQFHVLKETDPSDSRLYNERYPNGTIIESSQTRITLKGCNEACGMGPNVYGYLDIQKRIATWVLPLFILIGSMHFVPLGKWNGLQVILHVLGDPINSFRCLLSKLATYQRWHLRGLSCTTLGSETRKDLARIMLAYDAWQEVLSCRQGHQVNPTAEEMLTQMTNWLEDCPQVPETKRIARLNACRAAANELSDCRVAGFAKTLIGTVNYVVIIIASLVHINKGEFNNRTGHSIAFGMLYSWVIPTALLSSLVGGFVSKYSSKGILERLQMDLVRIELDSGDTHCAVSVPQISPFSRIPEGSAAAVYASLPWCGGNYLFAPRRSRRCRRSSAAAIQCAAIFPTLLAMCSGVFISYTSPTKGIGCRSVVQFGFYAAWVISAGLTNVIQAKNSTSPSTEAGLYSNEPLLESTSGWKKPSVTHSEHSWPPHSQVSTTTRCYPSSDSKLRRQWRRVLLKDICIVVPQLVLLFAGFSGVLNSCFCWSAWFNRFGRAHIVLEPQELIMALARLQWPMLALVPVLLHLLFVLIIWAVCRGGAGLFQVEGDERDKPRAYDEAAGG